MKSLATLARPLLLAAALAVASRAPAHAASALQCFEPAALAARPGEEHAVKGDHRFDTPPAAAGLAPFDPVPAELRGAIRRVDLPKGQKLIALTFDMCEQAGEVAGYDGGVIDYLRANGIKATLFTGGKWLRSHPERARQLLADPLFEIANHAEAHRNLRLLSGKALEAEIAGPQRAYETLRTDASATQCLAPRASETPARMSLFRFPYGACNDASLRAVNDAGLLAIQWDLSTGDPSPGTSAAEIASAITRGVKPGSIVISHANGRGWHTAAGLPLAIPKLIAQGFTFVTVTELLAAGKPVIAPTCYDNKPGDTDRYDHPLGLLAKARRGVAPAPGLSSNWPPTFSWETTTSPSRARKGDGPPPGGKLPWQ